MSMASERGGLQRSGRGRLQHWLTPWRWNWTRIARQDDPTKVLDDVFARPSIAPVAAWLIGGLIALVGWLTWRYAGTAAARSGLREGLDQAGIIPEDVGRLTIVAVAALALIAGWEPIFARRVGPLLQRLATPLLTARDWYIAWPRAFLRALFWLPWRSPSLILSLIDWALARPLALLAGVRIAEWVGPALSPWFRYAILAFWIVGAGLASTRLSGTPALWALLPGFLAIFAVVRRWTWVERDREAFLIERGGPAHKRVGFQEDLRDEALTAMVGLFALIPIALRELDLAYDAFDLFGPDGNAIPGEPSLWQWIGFFGAELAKSVPFVDWSEVYHVANGSPIRPHDQSGLGATLVFLLRATLDLLLLAAVLQAVQIAARLRDQNIAFRAGNLPILDPFAELGAFRPLAQREIGTPILRNIADAVADFPSFDSSYDAHRLAEIVAGPEPALKALLAGARGDSSIVSPVERDRDARDAAMLVLAGQHPTLPETAKLLTAIASQTDGEETRRARALALLADANPAAAEAPLLAIAVDRAAAPSLRLQALRDLGRLRRNAPALADLLDDAAAEPALRAHAGLALVKVKQHSDRTLETLSALQAASEAGAGWDAAMPAAYARALAQAKAGHGKPLSTRAALSAAGEHDKMAPIQSGAFMMGAAPGEAGAFQDENPKHEVSVPAFELGVYAVTFEEYGGFCEATGRELPSDQGWGRERRPAINVSWEDAHAYCQWLNDWSGERYRLPSEAEWEYACRAGTATPYSFDGGETQLSEYAWFDRNSGSMTHPVGEKRPNAFGLYDMHGNVREWCTDAWNDNYNGAPNDGSAWLTGDTSLRVLRGGSWNYSPQSLRSAIRNRSNPTGRSNGVGFRLARTVLPR